MKLLIRRDDLVQVISGNERGAQGKVLKVDREKMRAVVEGVALRKIHVRRTQQNPKGGIVEKEASLHLSNLMLVCSKCKKAARIGRKNENGASVRVCKKCGEAFKS